MPSSNKVRKVTSENYPTDVGYTEIAPGMYRNAEGWTVFRVDLNDYAAKGYVY